MAANEEQQVDWQAVVGRALAFLSLDRADMRKATLLEQSEFLERFGIPRNEAARILGSTDESLRVAAAKKKAASKRKGTKK